MGGPGESARSGRGGADAVEEAGWGREVPVVSSATPYACGLACLESWARERGTAFDHAAFIREKGSGPGGAPRGWERMPGLTRLDILPVAGVLTLRWDLYDLARSLGLARSLSEFNDRPGLEAFLGRPGVAAFALPQRYPEPGDPLTHAHCLRVLASSGGRLRCMDPGRRLPGRLVELEWDVFREWEPKIFGME